MSTKYQGSHNAAPTAGTGRRNSPGKRINPLPFILLALAALIIIAVLCLNSCGGNEEILGSWQYGQDNVYSFNSDGSGSLSAPEGIFAYTYKLRGDSLRLDFEAEHVSDSEYECSIEENVMKLIGGEGTVGGEYELNKIS